MRVIVATIPETSHAFPIVPLARALLDQGHEVLAVVQPNVAPALAQAGLPGAVVGPAWDSAAFFAARLPPGQLPVEAWSYDVGLMGALAARTWSGWARAIVAEQLDTVSAWQPDLIVCDPMESAARIAGGVLGVPVVEYRWGPDSTQVFRTETARRLAPVARRHGLTGLPEPALVLDPCPPSLNGLDAAPGQPVRYVPYNGAGDAPGHLGAGGGQLVCVSFGRIAGLLTEGRLLRWTLEALELFEGLDIVLAVTARERADAGPLPGNIRILSDVPLSTFLDQCDLLVHHGGDGTGLTGLCAGVPQVVIPQSAVQALYGRLVERRGAGRNLPEAAEQRAPAAIAAAMEEVLADARYRARARQLQAEIAAMPPPAAVVPALERLAAAVVR